MEKIYLLLTIIITFTACFDLSREPTAEAPYWGDYYITNNTSNVLSVTAFKRDMENRDVQVDLLVDKIHPETRALIYVYETDGAGNPAPWYAFTELRVSSQGYLIYYLNDIDSEYDWKESYADHNIFDLVIY